MKPTNKKQSKFYCETIFVYVKITMSGRAITLSDPSLDPPLSQ